MEVVIANGWVPTTAATAETKAFEESLVCALCGITDFTGGVLLLACVLV